jgi:predicted RNase H-like HicB family nuclease
MARFGLFVKWSLWCYNKFEEELSMKFNIILTPAEEGGFIVTVPALDGCFTQGETEKEALKNAKEAIICYLEGLEKVNQIKSKPKSLIKEIEVHV